MKRTGDSKPTTAERRRRALEAATVGKVPQEIAAELGVTPRSVQRYIQHALKELAPLREAETLRALRLELLRRAVAVWTPRALAGDDPAAVRELCRLLTREAVLAGLDAPGRAPPAGRRGPPAAP